METKDFVKRLKMAGISIPKAHDMLTSGPDGAKNLLEELVLLEARTNRP